MKKCLFLIVFFFTIALFSQKEANIWYFGENAGLDFSDGTPKPLLDGKLNTKEGCATISNKDGNLLFYTDGITVYNKEHKIMLNGENLLGDTSSTHSAIIVPKPKSTNIYYIFTVDTEDGDRYIKTPLSYSEVNMELDNNLGGITSRKNVILNDNVNEKIAVVKKSKENDDGYWVVSHVFNSNKFITFDITDLGVNELAIESLSGIKTNDTNEGSGQIKIAPKNSKIAVAHGVVVELLDFDNNTGKISNPLTIENTSDGSYVSYGIEFSPSGNLLYVAYVTFVGQYNLLAGSITDINNSEIKLPTSLEVPEFGSLQLAPDGRIYKAKYDKYLDYIENPNVVGVGCNYVHDGLYLGGRNSILGLPTFIQSFFRVDNISFNNTCFKDNTEFTLSNIADSVIWDFGDPDSGINNTGSGLNVNHIFSAAGIYTVTTTATLGTDTTTTSEQVVIHELPIINTPVSLKQCDNSDIDGFSFFNLNEVKEKIITNPEDYTITFFEEKVLAENNTASPISNITNYKNEIASVDTIWARVENNNGCFSVSEVELIVSTTQIPATLVASFYECDDGLDTNDGIATFNFSAVTNDIIAIFPANQKLIIKYYRNEDDALSESDAITDISNYQNIGYPNQQNVYIRVDSELDNDCLGLGAHISLHVETVPIANSVTINPECDNDRDGLYSFDTSTIQNTILGNQTNVSIRYFDENNVELSSPLPNPFATTSQKIIAKVENINSKDMDGKCSDEIILDFIVNSVPIVNTILTQEACDDDVDGITEFDTSVIENTILGSQTGLIVKYFDQNNNALPSPLPNPFITTSQTIRIRVENPTYSVCYEETTLDFIVREKPLFDLITEDIICMTANPKLDISIENPDGNHTYTWRDDTSNVIGNTQTIEVSKGGIYKVIATSIYGCDSYEKEINIIESSISTININDIEVKDDSDNNTIQINTTNLGLGDYEFRLFDENGTIVKNYQNESFFENLQGGVYTIGVNDKNGCGETLFEVSLLEFPKFFTPNNDGKNDFWQINGISTNFYKSGKVSILDRYGKLITNFTINDIGWDGTYKGKLFPSNTYWFYAELVDQKDITRNRTGYFSLNRR